jgi:Uma2 family endonuclease
MNLIASPTELILGPELAGTLMTPEEFDAVEEWDETYCYELVHGVLVVTPIPLEGEASPNDELGYLLRHYRHNHPQGKALDETLPERIVRTPTGRRRADRVIWTGLGRAPDRNVDVPSIITEFVSKARRDRKRDYEDKRDEYMEIRVAEYWIIDRFRRNITVFINRPTGPEEVVIAEGAVYRTPLLPGFELPLARLLAVADRYTPGS